MAQLSASIAIAALLSPLLAFEASAREIAVVIDGDLTTYEQRFVAGAKQAGENLGVQIKLFSPSVYHDSESFVNLMRNVLNSKPLGVVVEARWNTEIAAKLRAEHVEGNIVWTTAQTGSFSDATNFVVWDDAHAGTVAADALAEAVRSHKGKSDGDIVLIQPSSQGVDNNLTAAFKQQLREKYPYLKIIDSPVVGSHSWSVPDITAYITAHPNLVGLYASTFLLGSAAAKAVVEGNNSGRINIVATDGLQNSGFLFNNNITEHSIFDANPYFLSTGTQFVVQDPFDLAYQGTKTVFELSKGDRTYQGQYIKTATTISGDELPAAFRNWTQGPGLNSVADPSVVPILYATDRKINDRDRQEFNGERDNELHYGIAFVRVPDHHQFGQLERPSWLTSWFRGVLFGNENDPADEFLLDRKQGFAKGRFDEIVTSSSSKSVIIFVHGFRNTLDNSLFRFAQLIFDGQLGDMIPIMFSWPSRGDMKDYEYDGNSARDWSRRLRHC